MATDKREPLRAEFKPDQVKVLFIGESRPHNENTFFYCGAGELYQRTVEAFTTVYARPWAEATQFLKFFKASGCYLDDLCSEPVNHLRKTREEKSLRRRKRNEGVQPLAGRVRDTNPDAIFVVMKAISGHVQKAIELAGVHPPRIWYLPFPAQGLNSAMCRN